MKYKFRNKVNETAEMRTIPGLNSNFSQLLAIFFPKEPCLVRNLSKSSFTAKYYFSSSPLKYVSQQSMNFSITFGSSKMEASL